VVIGGGEIDFCWSSSLDLDVGEQKFKIGAGGEEEICIWKMRLAIFKDWLFKFFIIIIIFILAV
jgi:hypothetical protein